MSYSIRDGANQLQTMAAAGDGQGSGIIPEYNRHGSTGTNYSANPMGVPADTNNALIATIPANLNRALVCVQNQSQATIQIVRDDGAGGNVTSIFLAAMFTIWESSTFKGRIRVYGPATAAVAAFED